MVSLIAQKQFNESSYFLFYLKDYILKYLLTNFEVKRPIVDLFKANFRTNSKFYENWNLEFFEHFLSNLNTNKQIAILFSDI